MHSLARNFFRAQKFINHWLHVVDEHSIHSPFYFDFYNQVLRPTASGKISEIEVVRNRLLQSTEQITLDDLGAPSPHFASTTRPLSKIAATSASTPKMCAFYYRLATYLQARTIVELGTSVGLTTLYLAHTPNSKVITFEGNAPLVQVANTHFEYFNPKNIELVPGNIDQTLPRLVQHPVKIDLALMDANHRYAPTLRYFNLLARRMQEQGVIIVDDIYYSPEMATAWNELKNHPLIYGSVDLYRFGILFFNPALNRQHYVWSI
ncbi:MAG: class I SAM-dependent methyltransferase [Cyclobacteriaceae bacterium]|nr:class I SAM-dependent methyltransferase [Cyclobacteriaceae bacterium]